MPNDDYTPANVDVLFALGSGRPESSHVGYDGTPESWASVLQRRRQYYAKCQARDEAFALEHPGLNLQRLCDRPEIQGLLEDIPPDVISMDLSE
ncbi:hypothetical protein E7T06_16805 [Deinococcus sp. Arct2-2]|uniref:hypothetical protein n=1 Tax=Deinococcus sp. Arct2-2 TaxID=2568653 RepID=UPI0010A41A4F|nr:hypothetical protein [Deinococcus sp. Arct2-2]THF68324.1 hypothetical protein E7T06_16805 [Deinococcus sp. Arct2-2]